MHRRLIAAALAAAVLPFAALDAAAKPGAFKQIGKTYARYCETDAEGRVWVANRGPKFEGAPFIKSVIKKGTVLNLRFADSTDETWTFRNVTVQRDIKVEEKIELDLRVTKKYCQVFFTVKPDVKIITKPSPFQTGPNPRAKRTAS